MTTVGTRRTIDTSRPILGFAIVAHHIGDLKLYLQSVDEIAALGANALTIVTPLFQEHVDSNEIRYLPKKCPTEGQLEAIFHRAKQHGMTTILQPIVLIEKPRKKDWRGVIAPNDWQAWWKSYHKLIDKFLRVANASNVDLFIVGSELNTTEDQLDEWREIIEKVRANFPGQITYSANWDRYRKTQIWPLVDAISVSAYFELERDNPGAPLEKLIDSWSPIRDNLTRFARDQDLPLILSEIGYPSLTWANAQPWNYVAGKNKADHALQARCYEAFFAAWSQTFADIDGPAAGFFCYHWDPYHRGHSNDTGYGVKGKPAKKEIERGFKKILDLIENPPPLLPPPPLPPSAATQPATAPASSR